MHLLVTVALIFSLLCLAVLGVSNIERDLIRPPRVARSAEEEDPG